MQSKNAKQALPIRRPNHLPTLAKYMFLTIVIMLYKSASEPPLDLALTDLDSYNGHNIQNSLWFPNGFLALQSSINRRLAVRLPSGKWGHSLVKHMLWSVLPDNTENGLMVAIATRRSVMAEHKFATCPTCQQCGQFEWLGEQRWPEEVARKLGLPSVITLWSCPSCMTTISDSDLLPPHVGKNYSAALEANARKP